MQKTANSEPRKENPHFGFHENLPVWVKSGSNGVLRAVLTQTACGFIWVSQGAYSIKTAVFATFKLQKRLFSMVGVSGFEPEASWTRTKRDTKLRHTPIANILYWIIRPLSRAGPDFSLIYASCWPLISRWKVSFSVSAARRHRSIRFIKISRYSITGLTAVSTSSASVSV